MADEGLKRADAGADTEPHTPPRHNVRDLMAGQREVILVHEGHDYRLRITSSGKLILTK